MADQQSPAEVPERQASSKKTQEQSMEAGIDVSTKQEHQHLPKSPILSIDWRERRPVKAVARLVQGRYVAQQVLSLPYFLSGLPQPMLR